MSTFNWEDEELNVSLTGRTPTQNVSITRVRGREAPIDYVAFGFHAWCYSTLIWRLSHFTKLNLYKLIRSLGISLSGTTLLKITRNSTLRPVSKPFWPTHTALLQKLQPLFLPRLPPKLRSSIWEYVPSGTAYSDFLLIAGEAPRLARSLRDSTDWVTFICQDGYGSRYRVYPAPIRRIRQHRAQ